MVSVSVDEALTRVRDEKRRLRKEEKETMDFVEEEEMREEVRVWSESEESDEGEKENGPHVWLFVLCCEGEEGM